MQRVRERERKKEKQGRFFLSLQDEVKEDLAVEVPPYDDDIYEDVEVGGSGADDDDFSDVYAAVSRLRKGIDTCTL